MSRFLVDSCLGPVSSVRNNERVSIRLLPGVGDGREGVPFKKRSLREAREASVYRLSVVEVKTNGMVGEHFSADRHLAKEEPGGCDAESGHDQQPKDGVPDHSISKSLSRLPASFDRKHCPDPEDAQGGPADETVDAFEVVMVLLPESRVGEANHRTAENAENPRESMDSQVVRVMFVEHDLCDGCADGRDQKPSRCADASTRMHTSKVVDLGAARADPEGEALGNGASNGVKKVDDGILADNDCENEVDGCENSEPFGVCLKCDNGDQGAEIEEPDQAEELAVDNEKTVSESTNGSRLLLVGNISRQIHLLELGGV